jgi:c-di-GMP-binding flagellar brake protein YcgR
MSHEGSPPRRESRLHPRVELVASVELQAGGMEPINLVGRNLSLGGMALLAGGTDLSGLRNGARVKVVLFDGSRGGKGLEPVKATALVVRHDPDGIALRWIIEDQRTLQQLGGLIAKLKSK